MEHTNNMNIKKPQAVNTFVIHRQDALGEVVVELLQDYPYTVRNEETQELESRGGLDSVFSAVMTIETAEKLRDALIKVLNPMNTGDMGNLANTPIH